MVSASNPLTIVVISGLGNKGYLQCSEEIIYDSNFYLRLITLKNIASDITVSNYSDAFIYYLLINSFIHEYQAFFLQY